MFKPKEEISDIAKFANAICELLIERRGIAEAALNMSDIYTGFKKNCLSYPTYHPLKAAEIIQTEIPLFYLHEVLYDVYELGHFEKKDEIEETIKICKEYYDSTTNG